MSQLLLVLDNMLAELLQRRLPDFGTGNQNEIIRTGFCTKLLAQKIMA